MCPKDTIKDLAKDTRGNPESCFFKAEKPLGGSTVMLLPRTILNPLPNSGNYCVLWFIGYLTGCDRARSLWIDNVLLIAAVCHLLRRSTRQLRIVKCHQIQVFVPLGGAICLSVELGAANMPTLQSSTSTSTKVGSLDRCAQVAALPCSLWDAECPRGTYTWCHFEDWLEQMLCSTKSPEAPCATLTLLWNNISASLCPSVEAGLETKSQI